MENKMEKHLTAVAALQVGISVLGIVAAIVVYSVLMSVTRFVDEREVEYVLPLIAKWVSIFLLIISVFNLLNIPLGTAIAIYSIWVLVQDETSKLFSDGLSTAS